MNQSAGSVTPLSADEIAAAMAGEDLDLENLGLHGGYGNISATIAQMLFDHSYNLGSYEFRLNGARVGGFPLTPSDMPAGATSAGTSHAGDATYRDQYSLAAGSHYGFLFVTDELASASIFTISGTTITLYANFGANVWSAGGATDRKARISGGFVQVQCGATFGAGYVSTFFLGTVR